MGRPGYAAQVGAQPQRNVRNRHEVCKISLALGSAKYLGLVVAHTMPQPRYGQVIFLSFLSIAAPRQCRQPAQSMVLPLVRGRGLPFERSPGGVYSPALTRGRHGRA